MALRTHHPTPAPRAPVFPSPRGSTTGQEDVQALVDALLGVIQTAPFDDMSWAEIDRALMHTSHQIKAIFSLNGTLDPPDAPPPPEDAPAARRASD